jgi:glycyl-tRNA synthetase beta chain
MRLQRLFGTKQVSNSRACQAMAVNLQQKYAVYDYNGVADILSEGISAINDFLDNVLVMHDNPAVKDNRMHLLTLAYSLISPLGDIKKLN